MKRYLTIAILILSITPICGAQNLLPQPNKKGLWGYVNEKGKYAIKPIYQSAELFSSNLACVKINDLYGYINNTGQFIITPSFEYAESFDGSFAKCQKNGKFGFIDLSGKCIVDFCFEEIILSENKKFYVGKKENDSGAHIITFNKSAGIKRFDSLSSEFYNGYAKVISDGKTGYINENGILIAAPKYLEELQFSVYGIARSKTENGYGIVDKRIKNIIPDEYEYVRIIDGGNYIYGNEEDKFGLILADGKIAFTDSRYSSTRLIDGMKYIEVKSDAKISILNARGECLIADCDAYSFSGSIFTYKTGATTLKLDVSSGFRAIVLNGKDIWTIDKATSVSYEKPFILWMDLIGREHRMTDAGVAVFENYSKVILLSKGIYSVEKDGKEAVANTSGTILSDWVDGIIPIDGEYLQLIKKGGYGKTYCAIMRCNNAKMITGWDFAWVYSPLKNGLIPVKLLKGDNLSRTDKKLKMVGDNFYIAEEPSEGFYAITDFKTKKMGVMAEDGKILVSPKYDEVGGFSCGMCRVWIAERGNGFINKSGTLVVPCIYPQVLDFGAIQGVTNYTQVWDYYGRSYYIDKKGNAADPDKVMREAYDAQRQSSWY